MKVALISPYKRSGVNRFFNRIFRVPSATLPYLASLVPREHEVLLMDEAERRIDYRTDADLIALTSLTVTASRAYEIADRFRAAGKTVVMGGPHASACPEEALPHCDAVAIGNAESTLPDILADFAAHGRLKQTYHNFVPDSLPQCGLPPIRSRFITSILASRGCEMNCEFCSMQNIFGRFYLHRDVMCVRKEIQSILTPYLFFADDNFFGSSKVSQSYYHKILNDLRMHKPGVKWISQCRIEVVKDENTLDLFEETNCCGVLLGFESLNPTNGDFISKQKIDKAAYSSIINKVHSRGIGILASFIFGFDQDSPETIRETVRFCRENKIEGALFSILTPFPGTRLFRRLESEGRILHKDWDQYNMGNCVFVPGEKFNHDPKMLEDCVMAASKEFHSLSSMYRRRQGGMNYTAFSYYAGNILRGLAFRFPKPWSK